MAPLDSTASAHFYHEFFERNPQPLWVYESKSLRFVAVNDAAIAVYGYSRDEFLAITLEEICLLEDAALLSEYLATFVLPESDSLESDNSSSAPIPTVWRHRKKDGSIIEVEVLAHELDWNGVPARLVTLRDVTQMRRLQHALQSLAAHTASPSSPGVVLPPVPLVPTSWSAAMDVASEAQTQAQTPVQPPDFPSLAPDGGDHFFGVLAQNLAHALDVDYAVVALQTPSKNTVRTLGFWADGRIQPPIEYSIHGTLCDAVLKQGSPLYIPDAVQSLFPGNEEVVKLGAVSYYGAPLFDKEGVVCGHICVADKKPLRDRQELEAIFQIFVVRATLEINRREAEQRLRE